MSEREALQERIYQWLADRSHVFTAPYGILTSLRAVGTGKVRSITFGIARTLDAELTIWSPTRLDLRASRGNARFKSEQEFYDWCVQQYGAPAEVTDQATPILKPEVWDVL